MLTNTTEIGTATLPRRRLTIPAPTDVSPSAPRRPPRFPALAQFASAARRVPRAPIPVAFALAVLAVLATVAPEPAAAQTVTTFISNTGQTGRTVSSVRATAFTTGTGTYTLSSVGIFIPSAVVGTPAVKIYGDTGGFPGTLLATMTNPGTITEGAVNSFTAPANTTLSASTTYWVVTSNSAATNGQGFWVALTRNRTLDSGAAAGWSIGLSRSKADIAATSWRPSSSHTRFEIRGTNQPTVATAIPDQSATAGTAFSYVFPANTFSDADTGDTLSYTATKTDDTALPTWLAFDAGTRTFSGTPQAADAGTVSVKVTASDGNGGSGSDEFDITVIISVLSNWTLKPTALAAGAKFRLLFLSSTRRNASSTDIADYNTFIQTTAAAGHTDIRAYSAGFRVVGCTAAVDARDNTATTYTTTDKGVPIYWLNGAKAADQYEDFYDGSWDDEANDKNESGTNGLDTNDYYNWPLTGCSHHGTEQWPLGAPQVSVGRPNSSGSSHGPLFANGTLPKNFSNPMYGLSAVFQVANTPATGAPTITGTAQVGQTLTAGTTAIMDAEGLTSVSYTYQWIRTATGVATNISGATASTYTLVAADLGTTIKVRVSFTDDASNAETLTSAATAAVSAVVPSNWTLKPTAVAAGAKFRLLFLSSTRRNASSTDIATYNTFIQTRAAAGHTDIRTYSAGFRVVGCTAAVDARDNTKTTYTTTDKGVPIYWLNGAKAADQYEDFYDGSWDDEANDKNESGTNGLDTSLNDNRPVTGCSHDGTEQWPLGASQVSVGRPNSSGSGHGPLFANAQVLAGFSHPMYGLSAVFQVAGVPNNPPTVATAIPDQSAMAGTAFSYVFPANTFSDADTGDTLSYTATKTDDTALPTWLAFTASTRTFSGTPQAADAGTVSVKVTASDGNGGSVSDTFDITVAADTTPPTLTSATVIGGGKNIELQFSEKIPFFTLPPGSAFTVTADGVAVTTPFSPIWAHSSTPDLLLLRVSPVIFQGQAVVVTYTDPTAGDDANAIQDTAGNDAATFTTGMNGVPAVTNNSTVTNTPATGAPTITGTAQVGQTLTAGTTAIMDADGLTSVSYTYQWIRTATGVDTNISGATASTYTLVAADLGTTIKVRVSFTDDASNAETLTSATTAAVSAAANTPATGAPTITGTAQVGQTLTATKGTIADSNGLHTTWFSNATTTLQWIRVDGGSDSDISSATDLTYTLVTADEGKQVKVKVDFTDDDGHDESLTSDAYPAGSTVLPVDISGTTGVVSFSGDPTVGTALTATLSDPDNGVSGTPTWQWARSARPDTGFTDISSATGASYTPVEMDRAFFLRATATYSDGGGSGKTAPGTTALPVGITSGVFIKNTRQTASPFHNQSPRTLYQGFRTGDNPAGYLLTLVLVGFGANSGDPIEVQMYRRGPGESGFGSLVYELLPPTDIQSAGDHIVDAPPGAVLEPETDYFLRVTNLNFYTGTTSRNADGDAASGWAISGRASVPGLSVNNTLRILVRGMDLLGPPGPPGSLSATGVAGSAVLTWTAPGSTGQRPVTKYQVRHKQASDPDTAFSAWSDVADSDGDGDLADELSVSVSRPAGTEYTLEVRAVNTNGAGTGAQANVAATDLVPSNWSLIPTGLSTGDKFRLLFLSSTKRNKLSANIADYNTFVQTRAANGHADIRDYSAGFRAVGCTAAVDARDNTKTTYTTTDKGVPIYWLNGAKAADQYEDFYDGSWDDEANDKNESGTNGLDTSLNDNWPLTGCDHDGTAEFALGSSQVRVGRPNSSGSDHGPLSSDSLLGASLTRPLYGLSAVFEVAAAVVVPNNPPTVATAIPDQSATAGTAFSYAFPANTFSDADTGDTLSYTATKADGTALPTWLAFTAGTRTFSGTPQAADAGTVSVKVTASDGNGGSVSDTFDITVAADTTPPTLTSVEVLAFGNILQWRFSENLNVQPGNLPPFSAFTVTADGRALTTNTVVRIPGVVDGFLLQLSSPFILQGQTVVVTYTDPTAGDDANAIQDTAGNDAATFTTGMNGVPAVTNNSTVTNTPATGAPTITGTAQVGQTLTAGTTAIMDADGLTSVSYTYQWIRTATGVDTNISGATASTYTLVAADLGTTIKVRVSFTDDASNAETLTSAATAAVSAAPNTPATGAPTITGTAQVGQTLTAGTTAIMDDDGLTTPGYTYQWIRTATGVDTNISGATASTYTLVAADLGTTVKVRVSFTDDASNAETLTSTATAAVAAAANTPATGAPTITGTAQVGQTLTADTTAIVDADGLTNVSYTYQWIRVDGGTETNIASATASTYTLVAADQGTTIKVTVSFTDDASNAETLTSAATAAVSAAPNTPATGAPTITGTAQVGQTLTAGTTAIMDDDGLTSVSYTYQWIRVATDNTETNIASATASTYTLVAADQGTTIKVTVSFTDDASNAETLTSAATATVSAAPNTLPSASNGTVTTNEDNAHTFTASEFNFSDADGDTLSNVRIVTLPASGKGTLALSGTPVTANQVVAATNIGTLAYTPPANANGTGYASFTFKVSDGTAESAADYTMTINVTAVNDAPTVATVIPDQSATAGTAFSYAFPDTTFTDADTSDTLTYTATKTGDTALPTWLAFAAGTRTFSGTPQAADTGTVAVKVTASDSNGGSVSDEFDITVAADPNAHCNALDTSELWCGTLTVGRGSNVAYGYNASLSLGSVAPRTFTHGGATITVNVLLYNGNRLGFYMSSALGAGDFSLEIGTGGAKRSFAMNDPGTETEFFNHGLSWSANETVPVKLLLVNTPATGAPAITGTAQVGQTLTATLGDIADVDGLPDPFLTDANTSFQWIRVATDNSETDIGAMAGAYTLVADDQGTTIKVKVSFTGNNGFAETRTSAATAAVSATAAVVPANWSLKPTGRAAGDQFRLLFLSSTKRNGSSTDIATYNTFVQERAAAGHADIRTYSAGFRAVGCTSDVDARDNTRTTGTGVPIYWLNGAKAADNYADFYDGSWDDEVNDKNESGTNGPDTSQSVNRPFTGCEHNGTEALDGSISQGFGAAGGTKVGRPNSSSALHGPLSSNAVTGTANTRPLYGLSEVFQVAAAVVVPNNPPAFSADTAARSVAENTAAGQNVGAALTATDADSDTLTYTLEGTDAASFDIVSGSGQIRTRTGVTYNHEAKSTHTVVVKADDGKGGTDTVTVTITVTDVDEPPGQPAAPTVSATAGSTTSLDVTWTAPTNTGPAIASYDLQYRAGTSGNFTDGPQNVTGTSAAIGSLAADTSYQVQVRATNAEGDGDWSVAGTGRTTATSAPGAPTGLTATASGTTAINLSWSAPGSTGGSAITGYKIEVSANGTSGWTDQVANTNSTATTYAHTGLGGGDTRHYRVSAINTNGSGTPSNVDSATTGTSVPGAPTGLTATASGTTAINLSWSAPGSTGGSAITGYKIEVSPNGTDTWTTHLADTTNTNTTYAHTGLAASTTRHYRVSAINTIGTSAASNVDDATTGAGTNTAATGAPTITGTAQVGQTLTAVTTAIMDAEGLTTPGYTYQWIRVDGGTETNIASATSITYTLVAADLGTTIKVRVSFTDDASNDETLTSTATAAVSAAPNTPATGAPTITGTAQVGQTLTAVTTAIMDAEGLTTPGYTYQWIRVDGGTETNIASATSITYTLVAADLGTTIKVRVSFTDDASNDETLTSAATAAVSAAPNTPATGAPTITGTAQVGQTLTADTTAIVDADGLTNVSYTYQWIRVDGGTETNIASATASTYTLVAADLGTTIKVTVSFTDDASNAETLTSAATAAVSAAANNLATGAPTITGTAQVGQTLTAGTTGIMDADGLNNVSYTYQWIRVDGGTETNISGATASTHTLVAADQGTTIKVRVSFTDDASNAETLTSTATAVVSAAPNTLPSASDGTVTTNEDTARTFAAADFNFLDTDPGDTLSNVRIVTLPASGKGTLALSGTPVTANQVVAATNIGTLTYTPPANANGTGYASFTFKVSDGTAESAAAYTMTITVTAVNDAPTVATAIPDQPATAGTAFSYAFPANTFSDADIGDTLTYAATKADGATLPTWMGFAAGTRTFSGTPQAADIGTVAVKVTASDGNGGSVSDTFDITVSAAGDTTPPTLTSATVFEGGVFINLQFSENMLQSNLPSTDTFTVTAAGSAVTVYTVQAALAPAPLNAFWILVRPTIQQGQVVVVTYTDPTAGDDANAIQNTAGNDAATFTTGMDGVPAVTNNSITNTPATGAPTITGTATVGQTLTAGTTAIMDAEGLTTPGYTYQWIRTAAGVDTNISGATSITYTLVAADLGTTIKVTVSFTDDASNAETLTSAATAAVSAAANNLATGAPTITGTAQVGQTLTAGTTAIMDADGLNNVSYTYQWIRVDGGTETNISGATSSTYTLVAADLGTTIKVRVSFTDDASNAETLTSTATAAVSAAPNTPATGAPTITGTATVGQTLTAVTTAIMDAEGLTTPGYTYQWIRVDGGTETNIASATASTYTLVAADLGTTIKVRVSFTDDASNAETLTSAATAAVSAAPNTPATGAPTITGTAQVGQTLTAGTTAIMDADGLNNVSYTYQWIRVDGGTETNIASATASTYTLVAADLGTTIKVTVSFTDDASNAETLTSAATAAVSAAPNTPATGAPTITGTAQVGQTLTAGTTAIMDANGLTSVSYTYQWIRVATDNTETNIASATASTYTLVAADQGTTIKVTVSFTDDASNAETLTSAATAAVAAAVPNNPPAFSADTAARSVAENTAAGQNVGAALTATDADSDTLTYTLEGTDAASFDIVSGSGQIRTRTGVTYNHEAKSTHTVVVKADDGNGGTDTVTVTITVTDVDEPPGQPAAPSVSATAGSTTSLDVTWTAPTNTGPAIASYDLQYRAGTSGNFTNGPQNVTGTSAAIGSLAADTSYQVQVRATNAEGDGDWSVAGTGRTTATSAPGAPTGLTATASGATQIDLSWSAPGSTGGSRRTDRDGGGRSRSSSILRVARDPGSAITGYRIEVSSNGGSSWTNLVANTGNANTTYAHTGLTAGTTRHYRVSAINANGTGVPSNVDSATTGATAPGAPTGLTATASGTTAINLSWSAPGSTGGSAITGYNIEVSPNGTSGWTDQVANTNSTATTYAHTGLAAGDTRYYRVSAINANGAGTASNVDSATTDATAPGAPTGLTATASGTTAIDLSWSAPASTGGSAITGYKIEVSSDGGSSWSDLVANTSNANTTYAHTGLTAGTTRHYRVSAINANGTGVPSNVDSATTGATAPGAPTGLTATASGTTAINLSWSAPASTGGAAITGYRIEVSSNGGSSWTNLVANTSNTTTTYAHTGLTAGATRHYRVSAINANGAGTASNVDSATTGTTVPGAPTRLSATASGTTAINLSWSAPGSTGGSAITGYRIEVSPNGTSGWTDQVANTNSTATTYAHTGLGGGTTRHYRVSAINTNGAGTASNVANATTGQTTVTFGASSYTAAEGGATATVAVRLSAAASATVTIPLTKTHRGGATAADYSGVPSNVTFTAGQTRRTFTVTATDDADTDGGESVQLGFGTLPGGYAPGARRTATVTLVDDDATLIVNFGTERHTTVKVRESDTVWHRFIFSLSTSRYGPPNGNPQQPVTIPLVVTHRGGATPADYEVRGRRTLTSVTFAVGESVTSFSMRAIPDGRRETGEGLRLDFGRLPAGVRAGTWGPYETIEFVDQELPRVTASFGAESYTATEGGAPARVSIHLSEPVEIEPLVVRLVVTHVGATAADYTGIPKSVRFGVGEQTQTITVKATDDTDDDDGESVTLSFVNDPNGRVRVRTGPASATVALADNDGLRRVTVSFGAVTYTATEGGADATVRVELDAAPGRSVTVPLTKAHRGNATAADYSGIPMNVTFAANQTSRTFAVMATAGDGSDGGESVSIGFGTLPEGVFAGSPAATTVTLADGGEQRLVVNFGSSRGHTVQVREGARRLRLNVLLDSSPRRPLTIPLVVTHVGGATEADYAAIPESVTFAAGQTSAHYYVRALPDEEDETGEGLRLDFGPLPPGVRKGTWGPYETIAFVDAGQTANLSVAGLVLTLDYPWALDGGSTPSPRDFVVSVEAPGGEKAMAPVAAVAVEGSDVFLQLARPVAPDDTVTLSHLADAMHPIRDEAGSPAAPLRDAPVRNDTGASGLGPEAGLRVQAANPAPLAALLEAAQVGAGTGRLDLSSRHLTDITALAGLTGLRELDLRDNAIEDLWPLAGLRGLEALYLSGNQISDLRPLAGLRGLKVLDLAGNRIEDLWPLSGLTELRELDLADNAVADLGPLAGLAGLEALDLAGNRISDVWGPGYLTRLERLNLADNAIEDLRPLARLTRLEVLLLDRNRITDVLALSPMAELANLGLAGNPIANLWPLEGLGRLHRLDLAGNAVADLTALGRLGNLRWLWLDPATAAELEASGPSAGRGAAPLRIEPTPGIQGDGPGPQRAAPGHKRRFQ